LEEAQEAAAGLREQLTEARKKLREAVEEEKELKKKRRTAALALATVRARVQAQWQAHMGVLVTRGHSRHSSTGTRNGTCPGSRHHGKRI
jgi:chromosome segregation ATPase